MKKPLCKIYRTFLLVAMAIGLTGRVRAADVRAHLSAQETYVGLPITLRIQVSDASNVQPPTMPKIDGLQIRSMGTPSRSTRITTINGSTTTSTSVTFAYELTPQRNGSFHIPPITVHSDGADGQTRALEFVASKSDTGDLMFVEIAGKEKQIYVGQALDLTLKIWLRPYSDRDHKITLSEGDMWKLVSDRTSWGLFADRMQDLEDNNQRPVGKEALRKDSSGAEHSYYLYQIAATIYPKRPGKIDASSVKVVVQYPTAIGRARDPFADFFRDMPVPGGQAGPFDDGNLFSPFSSRLAIQSVRPIVAEATADAINVLPIPKSGRPADYRGAVGKYRIATEAKPTNVQADDPIELSIGISGTGPMELVEAPPMANMAVLTDDFKVPTEPLAGFVKGNQKLFTVSIRPKRPGITQIPAIPFSYFDPSERKFVTVHSDPISIHVDPADTLALNTIVGEEKGAAADTKVNNAETPSRAPSLSNFTSGDLLTSDSSHALKPSTMFLLLGVPPLIVLAIAVVRSRRYPARLLRGFKSNAARFRNQIEKAQYPSELADALGTYLARQLRLRQLPLTPREGQGEGALSGLGELQQKLLGALRSSGRRQLAIRCERLFDACEQQSFAGASSRDRSFDELKQEALHVADDLRSDNRWRRPKPEQLRGEYQRRRSSPSRAQSATKSLTIAVVFAGALAGASRIAAASDVNSHVLTLSRAQQKLLLHEANGSYSQALHLAKKNSFEAKQSFGKAAEKYQFIVDSGVSNSRLYINLANAYLESGQPGKAIANYLRSLKIDPTNHDARANLAFAERSLHSAADASGAKGLADPNSNSLTWENVRAWTNSYVSPGTVQLIMLAAWCLLWATIGIRLFQFPFAWKTTAVVALLLFLIAVPLFIANWKESGTPQAVVISLGATLHDADGPQSEPIAGSAVHVGQVVEPLKRRGDWLQVRTSNGQIGWLPGNSLERI
ncbi:MAG TPA: BatD family protein [Lacipirellulaceae bacterium]|nr:BatD family protein [Lacipirellulaceae bacterium]